MVTGEITGRHESNCIKPVKTIREIFHKKTHPKIRRLSTVRFINGGSDCAIAAPRTPVRRLRQDLRGIHVATRPGECAAIDIDRKDPY